MIFFWKAKSFIAFQIKTIFYFSKRERGINFWCNLDEVCDYRNSVWIKTSSTSSHKNFLNKVTLQKFESLFCTECCSSTNKKLLFFFQFKLLFFCQFKETSRKSLNIMEQKVNLAWKCFCLFCRKTSKPAKPLFNLSLDNIFNPKNSLDLNLPWIIFLTIKTNKTTLNWKIQPSFGYFHQTVGQMVNQWWMIGCVH